MHVYTSRSFHVRDLETGFSLHRSAPLSLSLFSLTTKFVSQNLYENIALIIIMFWLKDMRILWFLFLFLYRFTACACPISCFATQVDEDHLVWLGSWDGVMTLLDLRQRRFHVPSFCLTPLSSMWIWFILLYRRIYMAYLYILHINNKMSCSLCWIFILEI